MESQGKKTVIFYRIKLKRFRDHIFPKQGVGLSVQGRRAGEMYCRQSKPQSVIVLMEVLKASLHVTEKQFENVNFAGY